jgi:hypothetical protein
MIARACLTVSVCFWLFLSAFGNSSWAKDCKRCEEKLEQGDRKAQEIAEQTEYLNKNRALLAAPPPTESARLKLQGNIQLIAEKIAQLRKEMHDLDDQLEAEGCDACVNEPASL